VLHVGPTNSGKTFHALRNVAAGETGAYCGLARANPVNKKISTPKSAHALGICPRQLQHCTNPPSPHAP
jgi:hypothetical protein